MRLISLKLKNFVTHKCSKINLNGNLSYYIYSENNDNKSMKSNGAGKSLLIDALVWCLFGKTVRGFSTTKVRGKFEKGTIVESVWKDVGIYKYVRVVRKRGSSGNVEIFFSEDNKTYSSLKNETNTDTDKFIQKIFGFGYDSFINSVLITKPDGWKNFCESTDANRKDILTGILNIGWIDKSLKEVKKDISKIKDREQDIFTKKTEAQSKLDVLKSVLKDHEEESKKFELDRQEQIKNKKRELKTSLIVERVTQEHLDSLQNKIKILKRLQERSKERRKRIDSLCERKKKWDGPLIRIQGEIEHLYSDKKELLEECKEVKDKPFGTICKSCGSKYTKFGVDNLLNEIKKSIKVNKSKILLLRKDKKRYEQKVKLLDKKIEILTKFPDYYSYEQKIDTLLEESKEKEIQKIRYDSEEQRLKLIRSEISRIQKKPNIWVEKCNSVKSSVKNCSNLLKKYILELEEISKEYSKLKFWLEGFGNSGIKNYIISDNINRFEKTANRYLSMLTDGDIKLNVDNRVSHGSIEKISLLIKDNKKKEPLEYRYWSGGEKARIRFAIELAINSLIQNNVNLMIIDEGFDNMDSVGVTKSMDILQAESGKTVLCISNRQDIRNSFDRKFKVVLNSGVSSVIKE